MTPKPWLNTLCVVSLPFSVLLVGYFLFTGEYLYTFISLVFILVAVRLRVFMGYRGPRQSLFAVHLATTVSFVAALLLLIAGIDAIWIRPLSHVSFVGMVITGALLIAQTWKSVLKAPL
jgi:uncharacterized membrane protein